MPYFIKGFQMKQFWDSFSWESLYREGFNESKTDKKYINCYKKDSISKTFLNYYVFSRYLLLKSIIITTFNLFCTRLVKPKISNVNIKKNT